jgi:hypothetical protein
MAGEFGECQLCVVVKLFSEPRIVTTISEVLDLDPRCCLRLRKFKSNDLLENSMGSGLHPSESRDQGMTAVPC